MLHQFPLESTTSNKIHAKAYFSVDRSSATAVGDSKIQEASLAEAYALSPVVATISVPLFMSYVGMWSFPSKYVFATVTNACYISAGFHREMLSIDTSRTAPTIVGLLAPSSLLYVLMGASSIAFHSEPTISSPSHTLDIVFGWLIVSHVAYTCFAICSFNVLGKRWFGAARTTTSLLFFVAVALVVIMYKRVYANQIVLFLIMGAVAAFFGGWSRIRLARGPRSYVLAAADITVALLILFAAILTQCELLGVRYEKSANPKHYDFYHGQWHMLNAMLTAMLYSRATDAARTLHGVSVCVCSLPILDGIALVLMAVYSLCTIVSKETRVNLEFCEALLFTVTCMLMIHATFTLYFFCARRLEPIVGHWPGPP